MASSADHRHLVSEAVELAEKGFSQRANAEVMGRSQTTVSGWLRQHRQGDPFNLNTEPAAIIAAARTQRRLLDARRRELWRSRDDALILSELTTIASQMRSAISALVELGAALPAGISADALGVDHERQAVHKRAGAGRRVRSMEGGGGR